MSEYIRLSYSKLWPLLISPGYFQWKLSAPRQESTSLSVGSVTDILLTQPEEFDKQFIITKAIKPTAQLGEFTDTLVKLYLSGIQFDSFQEMGKVAYEQLKISNGGKLRNSLETFLDNFDKDGVLYYNEQIEVQKGLKRGISEDIYNRAVKVYESLINNTYTAPYFKQIEGIDVLKQLTIEWKYKGIVLKSILDLVKINHNTKTIELVDIKTTGDYISNFNKSVLKYHYWLQMGMYALALYQWIKENRPELLTYNVVMKWMVESTEYPGFPVLYKFDQFEKSIKGGVINGELVKGFEQLIDDYKWYCQHGWTYKREIIENNGEINVNIFE